MNNKISGYRLITAAFYGFMIFQAVFCKSATGVSDFTSRSTLKGVTSARIMTGDRIDTGKTYQVFFVINEEEECIKVNVNAVYMDEAGQSEMSARTFFVIEKAVDISRFGDAKKKLIFTEIGRNFDFSWNRERDALICTSEADPIKKLKKDIYRIRFTTFRDEEYSYEINIQSENKILIEENRPDVK